MKRLVCVTLLLIFVFTCRDKVLARQENKDVTTDAPVSRQDLERATRSVRRAIESAKRKSAEELAIERENLRKQTEKIRAEQEVQLKKLHLSAEKARAEALSQAERLATEQRSTRNVILVSLIALFIVLILGFVLTRSKKLDKGSISQSETNPEPLDSDTIVKFQIHSKTDLFSLHRFVAEHKGLEETLNNSGSVEVRSVLEIPYREGSKVSGTRMNCKVVVRKDADPVVVFDVMPNRFVTWKNRNFEAAKIAIHNIENVA